MCPRCRIKPTTHQAPPRIDPPPGPHTSNAHVSHSSTQKEGQRDKEAEKGRGERARKKEGLRRERGGVEKGRSEREERKAERGGCSERERGREREDVNEMH